MELVEVLFCRTFDGETAEKIQDIYLHFFFPLRCPQCSFTCLSGRALGSKVAFPVHNKEKEEINVFQLS